MKLSSLLLSIALVSVAHAQAGPATQILLKWQAAQYPVGTPVCAANISVNCQLGYALTITGPAGFTQATIPQCAIDTASTQAYPCIGPADTAYTFTLPSGLPYGAYNFSLVTEASGSTGSLNPSLPLTASGLYTPAAFTTPVPGGVLIVQFPSN